MAEKFSWIYWLDAGAAEAGAEIQCIAVHRPIISQLPQVSVCDCA